MKFILLLIIILITCGGSELSAEGLTGKRTSDLIVEGQYSDVDTHAEIIKEIEFYLSSFDTFEANFVQNLTGNVQIREGRILIYRPGKARWEYNAPSRSVLIIDGDDLSFHDVELDQVSYTSIPDTPLNVLLHKDVKLSGDLEIVSIDDKDESVSIIVKRRESTSAFESLEMAFSKHPIQLHRLRRTNEKNHATTLFLKNVVYNAPLSGKLFEFPKKKIKRKKN